MTQVGNLKRFIRNIDRTSGGLVAPPSGDFHFFATSLMRGLTDPAPQQSMDTITLAGGPEWIRPAEDSSGFTLLRSGVYTFYPSSLFFHAGATPFTENQTLNASLFYTNCPLLGALPFCSSVHNVTADEAVDGVATAYQSFTGPSRTFFLPKGAVIELHRMAGPNDVVIKMLDFMVLPVAFAG